MDDQNCNILQFCKKLNLNFIKKIILKKMKNIVLYKENFYEIGPQ